MKTLALALALVLSSATVITLAERKADAAEHTKGARGSTKAKHEKGQARRENIPKAQQKKGWTPKKFGGGKTSKR